MQVAYTRARCGLTPTVAMQRILKCAEGMGYFSTSQSMKKALEKASAIEALPAALTSGVPVPGVVSRDLYLAYRGRARQSVCDVLAKGAWLMVLETSQELRVTYGASGIVRASAQTDKVARPTYISCLCLPAPHRDPHGDPAKLTESLLRRAMRGAKDFVILGVNFSNVTSSAEANLRKLVTLPEHVSKPVIAAYKELTDKDNRVRIIEVKKRPKITSKPDPFLERMTGAGILQREYVVVCTKAQDEPVLMFSEKAKLRRFLLSHAKCPSCQERFSEANTRYHYSISEVGAKAIDGSLWMSWAVVDQFRPFTDRWWIGAKTLEEDEFDVLAIVAGRLVAFELKDRIFDRTDAFKFFSKCTQLDPKHLVIVSTDAINKTAKTYLAQTQRIYRDTEMEVVYVEQANLKSPAVLTHFLGDLYTKRILGALAATADGFESFGIDLRSLLRESIEERLQAAV